MMRILALLYVVALISDSFAFVAQTSFTGTRRNGHGQRQAIVKAETSLYVATEPRILSTNSGNEDEAEDQPRIKTVWPNPEPPMDNDNNGIDDERLTLRLHTDGKLRLGETGPVILDGLLSSTWSAMEPLTDDYTYPADHTSTSMFLKATHPTDSSEHQLTLGSLVSCHRLLACARVNRYWMGPAFGTSAKDIPSDTQFLLVELAENGPFALILPLVDAGFRATLQASDKSKLKVICYSESGDKSVCCKGMLALHVSVGTDPFALLKQGFRQVADETKTFQTLDRKLVPPSINDFGWCTWDAFYSKVTPEGILEGVKALHKAGVPPRTLILDDGWQEVGPYPKDWLPEETPQSPSLLSTITSPIVDKVAEMATGYYTSKVQRAPYGSFHNRVWVALAKTILKDGLWNYFDSQTDFARQLTGFEPNFKFEKHNTQDDIQGGEQVASLKEMVHKLKHDLNVKNVYCWHALHGYWRGVSSELGKKIGIEVTQVHPKATNHLLKLDPLAEFDPPSLFGVGMITNEKDLKTFYEHIHAPLVEAGIDGVKIDVQSGVTAAGSGVGGGPHVARLYTQAMEESVSKNFASQENGAINCINCMCHSTENLYRYQVTSVARASEDFFPHRPESHSKFACPDWDMFHSLHTSAELHAAARSIGGCPVYVSDVPGRHNATLLKKLVLPDGSILRAQLPGRPTRDCLFADVGKDGTTALKIWNLNKAGQGVIGAFNVQGVAWNFVTHENEVLVATPPDITAAIKPFDVEALRNQKGEFAVWEYKEGALHLLANGDETIKTTLPHHDWGIFTIAPIQTTESIRWAPIGLGDMMNSGGALERVGPMEQILIKDETSKNSWRHTTTADITVRGPGRFVAYCQPAPSSIIINDGTASISSSLKFTHDSKSGLMSFQLPNESADKHPHELSIVWDEGMKKHEMQ